MIGVWGAASRRKTRLLDPAKDERAESGPWVQVSRLGNPLFNEVVVPMGQKDKLERPAAGGRQQVRQVRRAARAAELLPVLYPGVFPNLAALTAKRADLVAILLTGIPAGIVPGFQNYTGTMQADMLRLNVAIPPTTSTPTRSGWSAATWPGSRTAAGCSTTSSTSSSTRSPG